MSSKTEKGDGHRDTDIDQGEGMSVVHDRVHTRGHQSNAQSQLFATAGCSPTSYKDAWIFDMANPAKHSILEMRKEKSRDAARSRRGKENYEFYELAKLLPLPAAITSQLDKASIIRLSISYLKLRDFSGHGDPPWVRDGPPPNKSVKGPSRRRNLSAVAMEIFETHQGTHILQSLDGFAFALANDGRFLYISETVSIYLGLSQVEMTGSSVFDYVHQQDHPELAEQLGLCLPQNISGSNIPSPGSTSDEGSCTSNAPRSGSPPLHDRGYVMNPSPNKGYDRCFCLRMKSTLTKRGVHVKCAGYRVVHIVGQHRPQFSFSVNRKHPPPVLGFIALGIALPPPTITELRIDNDTFVMRLSPDFKIIYCEPIVSDLMDIQADDLTNGLLYDFCHAADLHKLRKAHVDLLAKGQVLSEYYRVMNRHGGYVWIQTCATTLFNSKSIDDQNIIAINYVLSGIENDRLVLDSWQLNGRRTLGPDPSDHSDPGELGSDPDGSSPVDRENRTNGDSKSESAGPTSDQDDRLKSPSSNALGEMDDLGSDAHNSKAGLDRVFSDKSACTVIDRVDSVRDGKFSRRKMEKPRKRKKEFELEDDDTDKESDMMKSQRIISEDSLCDFVGNNVAQDLSPGTRSPDIGPVTMTSATPQDLSLKANVVGSQSVVAIHGEVHSDWKRGKDMDCHGAVTPNSVKELEAVMNRHLPSVSNQSESTQHLRFSGQSAQKKSTIQWIGSQHSNNNTGEALPATNLLRTIYANRESVIRTNTRPASNYYSEMPVNMLTPPGSDAFKEQQQQQQQQQQQPSFISTKPTVASGSHYPNATMPNYTTTPLSVSMPSTAVDSYGMTPPSSVSPRDKLQSPFGDVGTYNESGSASCGNLAPDSSSSRLAAKQAYQLSSSSSEFSTSKSTPSSSASSAAAAAAYYSVSSFHNNHTYPEVNHNGSAGINSYEPCSRSVLSWYPVSYSS
ncbi:protein trachealess-like isoform X1 [Haliotis cracherodii]|uniref:protein trachealess-like isoform X1 n=1 Tax=Haliotis cracherodii TaxID=6455 RepID=UPI0039EA6F4C